MWRPASLLVLAAAGPACASPGPPRPDAVGEVRVDGDVLHYETFGSPPTVLLEDAGGHGPAVVLVHGGGVDRRVWDAQVEALAERWFVVRYDRRGYGLSTAPEEPYSDTEDLAALLDALHLGDAHLVGSSAGAAVAIDLALRRPERVRSLVLVGPALAGYRYSGHETQLVEAIYRTARTSGTDAAIETWIAKPGMFAAKDDGAPGPRKLRELLRQNRQVFSFPWNLRERASRMMPLLSEIDAPTLVVVGREDSPDHRVQSDLVAERMPGAKLRIVDDAGHMVHLERPEEFNDILLSFLERRDAEPNGVEEGAP